jgi:group I intron endonuclease
MVIYKATNKINGKVYIGKTENTLTARWKEHLRAVHKGSRLYFHRAIRKHGAEAFETNTLHEAKSFDELNAMETFFIILYQSHKLEYGYNMTLGGDGASPGNKNAVGYTHTDEWKEAARQRMMGNTHTAGKKHRTHPRRGIKLGAEHIVKVQQKTKFRMSSPEGREQARRMANKRWGNE